LIFICLIPLHLFQLFNPQVKLSTNEVSTSMNENMMECIVSSGNTLHVVWADKINSSLNIIVYRRSLDNGQHWGPDTRLSPPGNVIDSNPFIAACNNYLHVVYWRNPYNTQNGILPPTQNYYLRSKDNGDTWDNETLLVNNYTFWPGVACSGNWLYINFNNDVNMTNSEVFFIASNDSGSTWSNMTQISNANHRSEDPAMSASGNAVYLVWNDDRDDGYTLQLYYRYSLNNGKNWSNETKMSNNSALVQQSCYSPTVSANGNSVILMMLNSYDRKLTCFVSNDGGVTFNSSKEFGNASQPGYPLVVIDANNVYCVFGQIGSGSLNNYYVTSSDGGNTWSNPTTVATFPTTVSFTTPIFIAITKPGPIVHIVWSMLTSLGGHNAIYYTNSNLSSTIDVNYLDTTASDAGNVSSGSSGGSTTTSSASPTTTSSVSPTTSSSVSPTTTSSVSPTTTSSVSPTTTSSVSPTTTSSVSPSTTSSVSPTKTSGGSTTPSTETSDVSKVLVALALLTLTLFI